MQKSTLAAIIFAVTVFAFFVLVLPQYDAIKLIKEATSSRQALLSERTAEFNRFKELENQFKTRKSDISKIKTFLPERKQVDEIVSSIQNIAERSGILITGMTTGDLISYEDIGYKKMLVGIDVLGPYPSFVNFLKLMEQNLRLYDIYEVNAGLSTTAKGSVNFAIKANAYYLK